MIFSQGRKKYWYLENIGLLNWWWHYLNSNFSLLAVCSGLLKIQGTLRQNVSNIKHSPLTTLESQWRSTSQLNKHCLKFYLEFNFQAGCITMIFSAKKMHKENKQNNYFLFFFCKIIEDPNLSYLHLFLKKKQMANQVFAFSILVKFLTTQA